MSKNAVCCTVMVICVLSGLSVAKYSGGNGTAEYPYLIATPNDLNAIGTDPNDWDKHFKMIADVNLSEYSGSQFNLIGVYEDWGSPENTPFTGVFDGNGCKIENFTYQRTTADYVGLFTYIEGTSAVVKDVILVRPNIDIDSGGTVGALVAFLENANVRNCSVREALIEGDRLVGGLVGQLSRGDILRCNVTGCVYGLGEYVGGLAGSNSAGDISECYFEGSVNGEDNIVGGLVGWHAAGSISYCHSYSDVNGEWQTGGLVGWCHTGSVDHCRYRGSISGHKYVGGLIGQAYDCQLSISSSTGHVEGLCDVGGIVGDVSTSDVLDCFSLSAVDGTIRIGGLIGTYSTGSISNSYFAGQVSGDQDVAALIALDYYGSGTFSSLFYDITINSSVSGIGNRTDPPEVKGEPTPNMHILDTFINAGWDMVNVWDIGENQTYPFLRAHLPSDINKDDETNFFDFAILAEHWLDQK